MPRAKQKGAPKPKEKAKGAGLPTDNPDAGEAPGEDIDNVIPTRGYDMIPMVGLGGSTGSIGALHRFFKGMPADSGMVFVVILHLSPEHDSILAEMLQRSTSMPVVQAQDGKKVEANHVYVIPPGKHLAAVDGHLRLSDITEPRGRRTAVDLFFRTLADTHGPNSAAVVLSGADGDGATGIKRIKERGGLTIAQDPAEAEHPSMPEAAIATSMVDWILPIEKIPARLVEYRRREKRLKLPPEDGPHPATAPSDPPDENEIALRDVLVFLRARTGRDFSYYKRATIVRRISRRMQVNGLDDLAGYHDFLRSHPGEAGALLQDLLISVTNFFRDRDAFAALEQQIPKLFEGKEPTDTVRVWVPACASGEEAYSVAMLLCEHASTLKFPPKIQVFATDLDEEVIQAGRDGLYLSTIEADVSEERLHRFFLADTRGYRVRRELRDKVLFALHDLLKDSPFSRLDLICCRNLLIYLNRDAQKRAFEIFHFALTPQGRVFLGTSESMDEGNELFGVLDKKFRLYARRSTRSGMPLRAATGGSSRIPGAPARGRDLPAMADASRSENKLSGRVLPSEAPPGRESWCDVHYQLLEKLSAPSLIVDPNYDIVHMSQSVGRFLQFGGGEPSRNLLSAVHSVLRIELRAALFNSAQSHQPVVVPPLPWEFEGKHFLVEIRVIPAGEWMEGYLLVMFDCREAGSPSLTPSSGPGAAVQQLERELDATKLRLRDTVEHAEASTEELKASNEELQAMNEELRSATEELETSREELQSINEELTTVNQELKSKVDELAYSNSDLSNLMASTDIATIFLDRELRIVRYTPPAVSLFKLIPTDIGRPLTDLAPLLDYPDIVQDAETAIRTLVPAEREVHLGSRFFMVRALPYRTIDDRIAGALFTFVDVTARKKSAEDLRESEERLAAMVRQTAAGVVRTDFAGRIIFANQRFCELVGRAEAELLRLSLKDLTHPEDWHREARFFEGLGKNGAPFALEKRFLRPDGEGVWVSSHVSVLRDPQDNPESALSLFIDLSERDRAREASLQSQERLRLVLENVREYAIFSMDMDRRVTSWNQGAQRLLGFTETEILGKPADVIFTPEDCAGKVPAHEAAQAIATGRASDERWHQRKDGTRFWGSGVMTAMHDAAGATVGLIKIFRDSTEARNAQQALEESQAELLEALEDNKQARELAEAASTAKDQFLAVLSHELRTPLTPVLMATEILQRSKNLDPTMRASLEMISRNVKMECHLIDDLLDLTRITHGKLDVLQEPLNLHDVARAAIEVSRSDMEKKNQIFTVSLEATQTSTVGDARRLQQALWNLLKNASKFTPLGGTITLTSRNQNDRVIFEVIDSGIGISADKLATIFNAFTQGGSDIAQKFGGLGLGLAIAKATIDAHGGVIRAASEGSNRGTVVSMELPLT